MSAGTQAAPVLVFVSCAGSKEIHSLRLDAKTGVLDPVDVTPVPGTGEPSPSNMPLAFSPGKDMLYAALRTAPFPVSAFAVDSASGKLTFRDTVPLPAAMAYIATGGDGRLLMGASYKEGKLSVSRIGKDGLVEAPPLQIIATSPKAHCILAGRSGATIYATTVDGNAILIFRLDAESGTLVPAEPPAMPCWPGAGPRHLACHPRLNVLYCVNELAGSLAVFAIDPETGALTELQYETLVPPGFQGNARAADLHVTADGRFAYASVRNTHTIAGFSIDSVSGLLSPIGLFEVEASPRGFALDPQCRFLFCAGQERNTVGVYAIDPASGVLAPLHRFLVGLNPSWVETLSLPVTS